MKNSVISPKKIILLAALVLVLLLAAGWFLLLSPYLSAANELPQDVVLTLREDEDGTLTLSWPQSQDADRYVLELRRPYTAQEMDALRGQYKNEEDVPKYEVLYSSVSSAAECVLPGDLPRDEALTIWLNSEKDYKWLMQQRSRRGETPVERYTALEAPAAAELNIDPDADEKTARLSWTAGKGDVCVLSVLENGQWRKLGELEQKNHEGSAVVSFGEGKDLPMPAYGETVEFALEVYRQGRGLDFYGKRSQSLSLVRDDLLGTVLELDYTEDGHNVYTLSWNETKGEYYELQQYDAENGRWNTLQEFPCTEDRVYTTGHLKPFEEYSFRVTAKGGVTLPDSEYSATPAEVDFRTWESAVFSTIWPLMELEVYADAERTEVLGTVPAAKAFCVMDEEAGLFKIRYENGEGYIDSNYCLINLPEYMGDLCGYNITNSYSAIYMIHEFEIPQVTDTIVAGYENIQLEDESFMVPLLYPVAQRLISAAEIAQAEGYRLKIYDAYRPNMATRSIYDLTLSIIDRTLPAAPFDEEVKLEDLNLSAAPNALTYRNLVTKGSWNLGNFLATSGSYHNMGIALDLTLEDMDTGEELEMQTSMHDLSWYSVINENNAEAILLDRIMKEVGFGGLTSEWWHFQDNEVRDSLGLKTFMWSGVTPECWMLDDTGWRYRLQNGTYFTNTTYELGGVRYTFGPEGYVVE